MLQQIFISNKVSMTTKTRLMKAYIWATLLYGCETWTLKKDTVKRIEALEMWLYRRIGKVSWTEKQTNEAVLNRLQVKRELLSVIRRRKLSYFGHISRHESLQKATLEGMVEGNRTRGRPRIRWTDNITEWTGMGIVECKRAAQDRGRWRAIALNPRNGEGT